MEKCDNNKLRRELGDPSMNRSSDASILTTSTESESFETWTLVNDGGNTKHQKKIELEIGKPAEEDTDRVELIEEKDDNNKRDNDNADDFSDGISIISDNECAGRISPHPFIMEHSSVENLISTSRINVPTEIIGYSPITPPVTPTEIEATINSSKIEQQLEPKNIIENQNTEKEQDSRRSGSFFGLGIKGIFYLSLLVAVAAFIGKLKYPEWEHLSLSSQITPLTQRIEDLELQNNLLRAEIDILNKQVNYLNTQKDQATRGSVESGGGGRGGYKNDPKTPYKPHEDRKHFENKIRVPPPTPPPLKIWPGGGDIDEIIEPIDVPYTPLKNVESSGKQRSVEIMPKVPSNEFRKESGDIRKTIGSESKDYYEKKFDKDKNKKYDNYQKYSHGDDGKNIKFDNKYQKHDHHYDDNHRDYHNHQEDWIKDNKRGDEQQRFQKEEYDKYRKQNTRKDHHSGDKNYRDYDHNNNNNNKKYKNGKYNENDWHEKMMHNREEARKKHDKDNLNNWYLERGNGREEARVFEKKEHHRHQEYRKTGR